MLSEYAFSYLFLNDRVRQILLDATLRKLSHLLGRTIRIMNSLKFHRHGTLGRRPGNALYDRIFLPPTLVRLERSLRSSSTTCSGSNPGFILRSPANSEFMPAILRHSYR